MVQEKKSNFVFFIETLSKHKHMEKIRCKLGFEGLFVVNPVGRCGGLTLLWKEIFFLEIFNFSRHHINAIIRNEDGSPG
jgi:hypothetical protein